MTISPLLQAKINNNSTTYTQNNLFHDRIYQDLRRHANDIKPNEAKAKLIKQGPVSSAISAVADTAQDGKNFAKAVKTGKLGDNNLGRINDFGMKIGAVVIAAFLASGAKTKTDAIMKFIGSGTFFATMALWPKLFINLPARLVHGFNIGQRYVSAQGDKKDFFLDNQFLPWDAYSKEEMTAIGKRTGIDINSENGLEKIQRKMQKTALQNRTLWMATAGFATPLITSVIGNFVTPKVEDAVIKHGFEKSARILNDKNSLNNYLNASNYDFRNQKALEALFNDYQGKELNDTFFETLANMLEISAPEYQTKKGEDGLLHLVTKDGAFARVDKPLFKNPDDVKPIVSNSVQNTVRQTGTLVETLKKMYGATSQKVDTTKLSEPLKEIKLSLFKPLFEDEAEIKQFISSLDENPTLETLQEKIKEQASKKGTANPQACVDQIKNMSENITIVDNSSFFNKIKEYNSTTLAELRGRLKAYLDLLNPIIGETSESAYTKEYHSILDRILSKFDLKYSSKDVDEITIKSMHNSTPEQIQDILSNFFSSSVENMDRDSLEYQEFLKSLLPDGTYAKKGENAEKLLSDNLNAIVQGKDDNLTTGIFGKLDADNSIFGTIKRFVKKQELNLNGTQAQPIICANFERRLHEGAFENVLDDCDIAKARDILYSGNISNFYNNGHLANEGQIKKILNAIFNENAFNQNEKELLGQQGIFTDVMTEIKKETENNKQTIIIDKIIEHLKGVQSKKGTDSENYKRAVDLSARIKEKITSIYNNKTWARIFIPATIALIAITLLVQPLFGKIDDEYPEKGGKV